MIKHLILNQLRLLRDQSVIAAIMAQNASCRIDPRALIKVDKRCKLIIGCNVTVGAFSIISVDCDPHDESGCRTVLDIGDSTYIGELSNIRAAGITKIGRNCLIAQGVSVIGANHSYALDRPMMYQAWRSDKLGVSIEDDVWIGTNATVLPGVTIGAGSIIAAGSVVTTDVASKSIVAGIPARFLKSRNIE